MKIKHFYFILFLIFILFIVVGCSNPGINPNNYDLDALAQCLTEKEVKMYGTEWCSHCQNQKAAFGDSFEYVDYVDCDRSKLDCSVAGIRSYPTWVVDGKQYSGEQSFEKLASLAECELIKNSQ